MTDELPHRLQVALGDGYIIERELGGAGMSRVFAAQEKALQRRVVIKVLPPDLAAGVNHDRFRREIQVAAQLQHPHIVPLLAAGESGGLLWFTMPFIEGESLRAAIARHGRFSAREVVRILHDVTDALAYAHARGVVHRDIKPGNILTSGMHALVTDFGVAKALSASIPLANGGTTTGMAIGTPAYMAPEQLAADPAADHRMDIYAVGLLGYELLTGKSPFSGVSPQATLAAQLTLTPASPHRSLPDVPEALSNIIMQCLEKDANKRPPSATALLAELEALPMFGSGETPSSTMKRSRKAPLIAAGVVVLMAVGFVMAERRGGTDAGDGLVPDDRNAATEGAGAGAGGGAQLARSGDSAGSAHRDTVFLYRDTGLTDAQKATTLPIVISRAESIAIANVFRQRQAAGAATEAEAASKRAAGTAVGTLVLKAPAGTVSAELAPILRDSLIVEMSRVFADSITRVVKQLQQEVARMPRTVRMPQLMDNPKTFAPLIAPPPDGTTRLVVQPFNNGVGTRDLQRLGRTFADSIRNALTSHVNLNVVDDDLTQKAQNSERNFIATGWSLRADYIVTGSFSMRNDSLVLNTQFNHLRGGFTRTTTIAAPAREPFGLLPTAVATINAWVDSARVSRRPDRNGGSGRGFDSRGEFPRGGREGPAASTAVPKPPASPDNK